MHPVTHKLHSDKGRRQRFGRASPLAMDFMDNWARSFLYKKEKPRKPAENRDSFRQKMALKRQHVSDKRQKKLVKMALHCQLTGGTATTKVYENGG